MYIPHYSVWDSLPERLTANCYFLGPAAMAKGYKLVITHFLGPLAKYNYSALALPRLHIVFCLRPRKCVITTTCQVLVVKLRRHLLPFPSNRRQHGFLVSASLVFWKELLGTRVSQEYNWYTVKSANSKWKWCSHICLLTFLLKRGGGLEGVSVPLRVGWSVPALKSSQSVSWTVWCLFSDHGRIRTVCQQHFLNSCYCCLFHSHKCYCFDIYTPMSGTDELYCCLTKCCYMCRDTQLRTLISNVLFITHPSSSNWRNQIHTYHCHLVIML